MELKLNKKLLESWKEQLHQQGLVIAREILDLMIVQVKIMLTRLADRDIRFKEEMEEGGLYTKMPDSLRNSMVESHAETQKQTRTIITEFINGHVEIIEKGYKIKLADAEQLILELNPNTTP